MKPGRVTLVSNTKNTFVLKDIELLESMGFKVFLIYSPAFKDPLRFFWNRIREFFLSVYYLPKSDALFSWFNDYHAVIPLWIAKRLRLDSTIIVGGYDAVASPELAYGIFVKKNLRSSVAQRNYEQTKTIWVVHKSLALGCSNSDKNSKMRSGILSFLPELKTPIREVPTAYDAEFWKCIQTKTPKTLLTVANIPDERTFKRKGIPLFFKLAASLPEFHFTIAGIAPHLLHKKELPKNVRYLGKQTREALRRLFSQSTYYFQGSKIEGLPNVLCEAMLCECIPVGNGVFGIPDAIGDSGFVFDATQGIDPIRAFLKKEVQGLGTKARQRIKKRYPFERRKAFFEEKLNQQEKNE